MVDASVIGCGNMGGALVRGLVLAGYDDLIVCDVDPRALDAIDSLGVRTTTDPAEATDADIVFLAVKPNIVETVLEDIHLDSDQTIVSIAAGIPRTVISRHTAANVVRVMPNLAAEWGSMAAAITGEHINEEIVTMLDAVGEVVELDESQMDTATALNGSGPAFVFYLIQAMTEAGVDRGLEHEDARTLAAQTFKGAAETVQRSDTSLDDLIEAVCSPQGTTIEGMAILEESSVADDLDAAIGAAEERATELSMEIANE